MRNGSLLNVLSVILMSGLMVSCVGLEENDPSAVQMPDVKTLR